MITLNHAKMKLEAIMGNTDVLLIPAETQVLIMYENRLRLLADGELKSSGKSKFLNMEDVGSSHLDEPRFFFSTGNTLKLKLPQPFPNVTLFFRK